MHPTVPANPAESRAHAPHCARKSSRIMGTCTSLCPRILPNHGHMHPTAPTNPPESCAHAPHCAHEFCRITGTCSPLCPRILPNHGHMHPTVPANPPESRAHAPHCAHEFCRITGKSARTTPASSRIPGQTAQPRAAPALRWPMPATTRGCHALWAFLAFSCGPEPLPPLPRSQGWPEGLGRAGSDPDLCYRPASDGAAVVSRGQNA